MLLLLMGLMLMMVATEAAPCLPHSSSCASSAMTRTRAKALRPEQLLRERVPSSTVAAQTW